MKDGKAWNNVVQNIKHTCKVVVEEEEEEKEEKKKSLQLNCTLSYLPVLHIYSSIIWFINICMLQFM